MVSRFPEVPTIRLTGHPYIHTWTKVVIAFFLFGPGPGNQIWLTSLADISR